MKDRIRVGIVGLKAERGWANAAHIPALRALSDDIEVVGVANTNQASAEAAVSAFGLGRAYDSVDSPRRVSGLDVVVVTVKVPHHLDLVTKVLEGGKNVYCEWPLGNGLAEAEQLAALAKRKQVVAVVGTQAVVSPEVQFARDLVADGFVGEVRSTTYVGSGFTWGDDVDAGDVYAMDFEKRGNPSLGHWRSRIFGRAEGSGARVEAQRVPTIAGPLSLQNRIQRTSVNRPESMSCCMKAGIPSPAFTLASRSASAARTAGSRAIVSLIRAAGTITTPSSSPSTMSPASQPPRPPRWAGRLVPGPLRAGELGVRPLA